MLYQRPGVLAGWMNRLVVSTYLAWQSAAALRAGRDVANEPGEYSQA